MTDYQLTLFPLSHVSVRFGYNHNINQGPSYSSTHLGNDPWLYQNWRNSTDTWTGTLDWKPDPKTTFSYDQFVTHYKGNTIWLLRFELRAPNGQPVAWESICHLYGTRRARLRSTPMEPSTPTCNATWVTPVCNRPARIFPTEQVRLQSSDIPNLTLNGRLSYNGANSTLNGYNEYLQRAISRSRSADTTRPVRQRRSTSMSMAILRWSGRLRRKSGHQMFMTFGISAIPASIRLPQRAMPAPRCCCRPLGRRHDNATDQQYLNQKTSTNTTVLGLGRNADGNLIGRLSLSRPRDHGCRRRRHPDP